MAAEHRISRWVDRMAAAGLTEPRCASECGLAMGGGRPRSAASRREAAANPEHVFASPSPEAIVSLAYRSGKIVPSVPRDLFVCLAVLRGATCEVNRTVVTNSLIEERERVGQRRCSHGRRRPGRTGVADDRQTAAAVNFDIDAENLLRLRHL